MQIHRLTQLPQEDFIVSYLASSMPIVVTDAISRWSSAPVWTSQYFTTHFGASLVQIYDDLFTLETVCTLKEYFDKFWDKGDSSLTDKQKIPYVRWYSQFKPVDFAWADSAFEALAPHWALPYFLPDSGYLIPSCHPGTSVTPVLHPFPGKGIFISARGARTRLHKDPWNSDAILCQVAGQKRVVLYHPTKASFLTTGGVVVDLDQPDRRSFPSFGETQPDYADILQPGEVLYIPSGWFHHIDSLSDSISLTWNFVHIHTWPAFLRYLLNAPSAAEASLLEYFATPLRQPAPVGSE